MINKYIIIFLVFSIFSFILINQPGQQQLATVANSTQAYFNQYCSNLLSSQGKFTSINVSSEENLVTTLPRFGCCSSMVQKNFQNLSQSDYMPLIQNVAPWILLSLFSIFCFIGYFLYCCCQKCCPPSKCCRQDPEEVPYTKYQLYFPIIWTVIFCLGVAGASIAGIIFSGGISSGVSTLECSFFALLNDIRNTPADTTENWKGMVNVQSQLSSINQQIQKGFIQQITPTFQYGGVTNPAQAQFTATIKSLLNSNALATMVTYGQNPGGSNVKKVLGYLAESYTPLATDTFITLVTASSNPTVFAKQELNKLTESVIAAEAAEKSSTSISQSSASITSTLKTAEAQVGTFINQIDEISSSLGSQLSNFDNYKGSLQKGVMAIFGVSLGFSCVCILAAILLSFLKLYRFRILVQLSWFFYALFMIFGFLIGGFMFGTSLVFLSGCDYINQMITNQNTLITSSFLQNSNQVTLKDSLNQCLFGQGKILNVFNAESEISQLNTLSSNLNQVTENLQKFNPITNQALIAADCNNIESQQTLNPDNVAFPYAKQFYNNDLTKCSTPFTIPTATTNYLADTNYAIGNYLNQISTYTQSNQVMINSITNPTTGIVSTINCKFFKTSLNRVYQGLCLSLIPAYYQTMIVLLIVSVFMFLGSFGQCCISIRYSNMANIATKIEQVQQSDIIQAKVKQDHELQHLDETQNINHSVQQQL